MEEKTGVQNNKKKKRGRPKKQQGAAVAPAIAKKPTRGQPKEYTFALDIGTRTVVGIVGSYHDNRFHVLDYEQMEHPGRAMIDGQVEDIAQVGALIAEVKQRLEGRLKFRLERVAIAAAGRMLKTVRAGAERTIDPRGVADRDVVLGLEGEAIELAQQEIHKQRATPAGGFYCVGYSIVEYRMDGQPVSQLLGHICSHASVELIAAFLPNSVVEGLYGAVDVSGLEVVSLTLEPIAAINVLIPPELRLLNLALVDIGAGTSDIAICREGIICSYEMATVAGDEVTEAIIRRYLVDFETAEHIKRKLSLGAEASPVIEFENILGIGDQAEYVDLLETAKPAVQQLAATIAEKTLACNGAVPAAIFLIGGGSQIPGLSEALGSCLNLDAGKIAVGARRNLKPVDHTGFPLLNGPEFITPLGIAVTANTQESFHFFGVTVNGKRFKLLNTSHMRCIDVLLMAGYRTGQIIGQSGRSLHYTLNGHKRVVKGSYPEHAVLLVNGAQAGIDAAIHPGDVIAFTPATHGVSARQTVGEAAAELQFGHYERGEVFVDNRPFRLGLHTLIGGKPVEEEREIGARDDVEITLVRTLRDILALLDKDADTVYYCDGVQVDPDMQLLDGIRIISERAALSEAEAAKKAPPPKQLTVSLVLNGEPVSVTVEAEELYVMNLLERANVDPQNPKGLILMQVNGEDAAFMHPVREHDVVEIGWIRQE